jgi:hypothetical protein
MSRSYNPGRINPPGLGCSHFVRHYFGNRIRFLFLRLLRCFSSAGIASAGLCIQPGITGFKPLGFPIRKSPDYSVFAAPRSLSQLTASFVALYRQGIHQLLLGGLPDRLGFL